MIAHCTGLHAGVASSLLKMPAMAMGLAGSAGSVVPAHAASRLKCRQCVCLWHLLAGMASLIRDGKVFASSGVSSFI